MATRSAPPELPDRPTQALIFDSPSICSRCLAVRQRELAEGDRERYRPTNDPGHPPDKLPTAGATWFCTCGAESPFHRRFDEASWGDLEAELGQPTLAAFDDREVRVDPHVADKAAFETAIKRAIVALEAVGHGVDRQAFAAAALQAWYDELEEAPVQERRLETGLDPAITAGVTQK